MVPLYTLLAVNNFYSIVPVMVFIVWMAVALIAFFIGFGTGFRRIGWAGVVGIIATLVFTAVNRFFINKNLVLKVTLFGLDPKLFTTVVLAIAVVLCVLIVYGLLSLWLRPSVQVRHHPKIKSRYGIEVEEDDDLDGSPARSLFYRNMGEPTLFGRIVGGLLCALNVTVIFALIVSAFLFIVKGTALINEPANAIFSVKIVDIFYKFSSYYALDVALIFLIVVIAKQGYKNGFLASIHALFSSLGGFILGALGLYLPFSPMAKSGKLYFTNMLVNRCTSLMGKVNETLRPFAGKLMAAVLIFAFMMLVCWLIKLILAKCAKAVKEVTPVRAIDGLFASLVYFLIGVMVCFAIFILLYGLDHIGLFKISEVLTEESTFARGLFEVCGKILRWIWKFLKF